MIKQSTLPVRDEYELYSEIKELFHSGASRMHRNHYGPKIYTDLQRTALLVLYVRSKCSLRRFCEVYLMESRWPQWLGLREIPAKSTLHDWLKQADMSFLRKLNKQLLAEEQPATMAVDGTGLDARHRSKHYEDRIRAAPLKGPKLDVLIDTGTLLVHDWSLLIKPRSDVHVAKGILRRTPRRGVLIIGDKGYDAEELYEICYHSNSRFFAPIRNAPRTGAPPKRLSWYKRKSHRIATDYHRRSLVESAIRSLKARVCALRSRLHYMKKRELALHVLARNLEIKISLLLRHIHMLVRFAHQA